MTSMGVVCLILLLVPHMSSAQDAGEHRAQQLGKMTLDQVRTKDGFEYYSGYVRSGNFPTMYAHGGNKGNAITVVGRGFTREYPIHEWRKAIEAYRSLLIANGYAVPPD